MGKNIFKDFLFVANVSVFSLLSILRYSLKSVNWINFIDTPLIEVWKPAHELSNLRDTEMTESLKNTTVPVICNNWDSTIPYKGIKLLFPPLILKVLPKFNVDKFAEPKSISLKTVPYETLLCELILRNFVLYEYAPFLFLPLSTTQEFQS